MFFEGPEKKVELVVEPGFPSLRSLGRERWQAVVEKSQAKILSVIRNEHCDAFLLSESSLFVYDTWLLMSTCGRTTLAQGVREMFRFIPPERIESLIFERKNEHFPHYQPSSFFADAQAIHALLPGRAFRFGAQDEHHVDLFHIRRPYAPTADDSTLEILMHRICDRARDIFCSGSRHHIAYIQDKTGVREFYDGFQVDDHVFEPMGYSLNAIKEKSYYTLHVTPESAGSYVSFETNHPLSKGALNETLDRLLAMFEPQAFDLVLFQHADKPSVQDALGYQLKSDFAQRLTCGYDVSFRHYYRPPAAPSPAFEFPLEAAAAAMPLALEGSATAAR